jgi:threonine dehydrogenase-like Zn-dependent dehydrogenase
MRAVTVIPLKANTVQLTDLPEPPLEDGPVLVKTRAIGICGTDIEIISGEYGWPPCRASTARSANGTCAATGITPNGA